MKHLAASLHIYLWIVVFDSQSQSMVHFNLFPRPSMKPIQPRNCPLTLLSMYSSVINFLPMIFSYPYSADLTNM